MDVKLLSNIYTIHSKRGVSSTPMINLILLEDNHPYYSRMPSTLVSPNAVFCSAINKDMDLYWAYSYRRYLSKINCVFRRLSRNFNRFHVIFHSENVISYVFIPNLYDWTIESRCVRKNHPILLNMGVFDICAFVLCWKSTNTIA